jgi:hypothetical protein
MVQSPSGLQNLLKLQRWLEYEISGMTLIALSWFWPVMIILVIIAALIFIPLMLKVLYQEKKTGWIISFVIFVIVPLIALNFINFFLSPLYMILMYLPAAAFFFYCFLLKLELRGWINDYKFVHGLISDTETLQ